MKEEGHFCVTFKLKDRYDSVGMKISPEEYDCLSKSLLKSKSEFIEINRENAKKNFDL